MKKRFLPFALITGYLTVLFFFLFWAFQKPANQGGNGMGQAGDERPSSTASVFNSTSTSLPLIEGPGDPRVDPSPIPELSSEEISNLCGACHAASPCEILTQDLWPSVLKEMFGIMKKRGLPLSLEQEIAITHYYVRKSLKKFPPIPPDPTSPGICFKAQAIGDPMRMKAMVTNVNVVDLDMDGRHDILVCDADLDEVKWISRQGEAWVEKRLARVPAPVHTEVLDCDGDGDRDILVAALGMMDASDEQFGGVCLLVNNGRCEFSEKVLLKYAPRVADAQPGDLDGDGDLDYAVGLFGWQETGGVGWLEQTPAGDYTFHTLSQKSGTIHVPTADLDGDGNLDIIALVSQEHEEITAFLNQGRGAFKTHSIFKAEHPLYGSSGIQLADLDKDGDLDVLYSNGDHQEFGESPLLPYFGVQWLENLGGLRFAHHHLIQFYGSYRAVAGDLDGDGDLDIVAASMFNDWADPARQSLIWLENDGQQHFSGRSIASNPTRIGTISLGDLNSDGRLDIVGGSMHFVGSSERGGRVTLWINDGKK